MTNKSCRVNKSKGRPNTPRRASTRRTPSTKRKRTPSNGYGKRNVTGGMTKAESYAINGAALGAIKGAVGGYMTGWAINKASPNQTID
jgi:hypothetical protein